MLVTTRTLIDRSGRRIEPGKLLGRGGEGAVHEIIGEPRLVAKIYHQPLSQERADKIETMARMASSELDRFCAWPRGLLMDGRQARGLLMPRVTSRKELHFLHGPKSRKTEFPDAGFDFLVHVALNLARAFAQLHAIGVIIGDVNDRGIMVGGDGTVRLIDCDSFQISKQQRAFHCGVGVPEYTPPELQGHSLSGIARTENHDVFGLAVIIFRLLFMGRHPFAGIFQGGHKEIHEAIREARYAYATDAARTRMQPPPNMLGVAEGAGRTISDLFEQAFSPDAIPAYEPRMQQVAPARAARPTARSWVTALEAMRDNLVACRFNAAHAYVRSCPACPWCELEQRYNVDLFHFIPSGGDGAQAIDVEAIWQALGALKVPSAPQTISQSLVRVQPKEVPPELVRLRNETASLAAEAQRAREAALHMTNDAERMHLNARSALAELAKTNADVVHIEARLKRLRDPEPRHPAVVVLKALCIVIVALCIVIVALGYQFPIVHFLAAGALIGGALYGIDKLVGCIRSYMAARIERRLDALRLAVVSRDPEMKGRFDAARQAAEAAETEARRTAGMGDTLEKAATEAQSRYASEREAEIDARNRQVKAAEQNAYAARTRLSRFATEAKALQSAIDERRGRLAPKRTALTNLMQQRDAEYKKLRDQARSVQFRRFLDTHYINAAKIKGITPALKSALASFGIETAADVNWGAVFNVPGFGKVRTQRMQDWRNHVAKKFQYEPGLAIDPAQRKIIESRFAAGRLRIARDFVIAQTEIERRIRELADRIPPAKQSADDAVRALAQARADRRALDN